MPTEPAPVIIDPPAADGGGHGSGVRAGSAVGGGITLNPGVVDHGPDGPPLPIGPSGTPAPERGPIVDPPRDPTRRDAVDDPRHR